MWDAAADANKNVSPTDDVTRHKAGLLLDWLTGVSGSLQTDTNTIK
jgi:hypothetical protein